MEPGLENAIKQVQTYIGSLKGIKGAPLEPPDAINNYPFSVCYPDTGTFEIAPTLSKKGLHAVVIELHVNKKGVGASLATAIPFCAAIPNLLFSKLLNDNRWNGTIDTFRSVSYAYGQFTYGGVETVGFKFTVNDIKIIDAIT
jgi:hypothetical protein